MNKKPRILMIAPLPPPIHGSAMMTQYIKDSHLLNESFCLDWINLSTSRSMDEIGKKSFSKIFRFVGSYFKTLRKLLTNRYDACYIALTCHGIGFLKDAPFVLMCKLFRHKIIIHQHNKGMSKDVNKQIYRQLFSIVYNNSYVILLSWKLYPDIEEIVKKNQIFICPNGIPTTKVYSKNTDSHVPQILFLSNLIESKGVLILLDACEILKRKGYSFICKFVGGETKEINAQRFNKEVKQRGLDGLVKYEGKKYDEEKNRIIASSNVLVFPTFYLNETFGLVILEAMQQATAVITTDIGGITDIIEDGVNGLICPIKDSEKLATLIGDLLDSPNRTKEFGENGQKTFFQRYTIQEWENKLSGILKKITENHKTT